MSKRISRRAWLTSVPALGGLFLTGCSRERFVPPRVRGGLIDAADVLTMSTNRLLLSGQQLAREYPRSEITDPFPIWDPIRWRRLDEEYGRHRSEGFRNWRLPITGLVARPRELSLDEIRGLPARTQITAHVCESGWSAIGEWTGTPLQRALEAAGGRHTCGALRRHRHVRPGVLRVIRSVRGRASSDNSCLRSQRPRPADRQRRAAPTACRTTVRIQEPQVGEIDSGRRLGSRLWPGHGWKKLGPRLALVRGRIVKRCRRACNQHRVDRHSKE